jgi:hypothetical protein
LLHGGLPELDTFSRFSCPQIIPHKLAFGETCPFPSMQTELLLFGSEKMVSISCLVLVVDSGQTCPISLFMHRNATAVYTDFLHVLQLIFQSRPILTSCSKLLIIALAEVCHSLNPLGHEPIFYLSCQTYPRDLLQWPVHGLHILYCCDII